jgi:hypothetical protein
MMTHEQYQAIFELLQALGYEPDDAEMVAKDKEHIDRLIAGIKEITK